MKTCPQHKLEPVFCIICVAEITKPKKRKKKKKYFRINQKGRVEYSDKYDEQLGFIGLTSKIKNEPK